MKKFVIAMVVIILIGAVLTGIGCAVFFSSGLDVRNVEYTEKFFETEEEVSTLNLHLENAHKVVFERGEKCSVKYFDSDVTSFTVSAQDGKLNISESGWSWNDWLKRIFYKFQTTEVVITVPENTVLDISGTLNGATEVTLPSWQYGDISLDVRGAGTISANGIEAGDISLSVSGAASLRLSGRADSLKTRASGAVKMNCDSLSCELIDIRSSGSSDISLFGTGNELIVHASGSAKLMAKGFVINKADIDASGSVEAELTVNTLLKVNTSGSSYIAYWGDPQVDKSTSGSSKVVKMG